jgi:hypothetical protein
MHLRVVVIDKKCTTTSGLSDCEFPFCNVEPHIKVMKKIFPFCDFEDKTFSDATIPKAKDVLPDIKNISVVYTNEQEFNEMELEFDVRVFTGFNLLNMPNLDSYICILEDRFKYRSIINYPDTQICVTDYLIHALEFPIEVSARLEYPEDKLRCIIGCSISKFLNNELSDEDISEKYGRIFN